MTLPGIWIPPHGHNHPAAPQLELRSHPLTEPLSCGVAVYQFSLCVYLMLTSVKNSASLCGLHVLRKKLILVLSSPGCHLSSPHGFPGTSFPFALTHSAVSSPFFSSSIFLLLSLAGCEFPNSSKQSSLTSLTSSLGLSLTMSLSTDDKGLGLAGQTGCDCVLGGLCVLVDSCCPWCCQQAGLCGPYHRACACTIFTPFSPPLERQ